MNDLEIWINTQKDRFLNALSEAMDVDRETAKDLVEYAGELGLTEFARTRNRQDGLTWKRGRYYSFWKGQEPDQAMKTIAEHCTRLYLDRLDRITEYDKPLDWLAEKLFWNYPDNRKRSQEKCFRGIKQSENTGTKKARSFRILKSAHGSIK